VSDDSELCGDTHPGHSSIPCVRPFGHHGSHSSAGNTRWANQAPLPPEAPTWSELLVQGRRHGLPGLVSVTWGSGELAELLSSAVESMLAEQEAHAALCALAESRGRRIEELEGELRGEQRAQAGLLAMADDMEKSIEQQAEELRVTREAARAAAQPADVERRAIAAVLDVLDRPDVDLVARVAMLVGEVRVLRSAFDSLDLSAILRAALERGDR
jgi:hypothetical protein